MSNIKILVCFHKPGEMPSDSIYLPIQVGKSLTDLDLNIQTDNKVDGKDCDNISQWNNIFCELTADYWAWKNMDQALPEVDYIGLCHYRRYFDFNGSLKDSVFRRGISTGASAAKFAIKKGRLSIYQPMKKINSLTESSFLQSNEAIKRKISAFDGIATESIRIYGGTVRTYFTLGYMYLSLLDEIVAKEYPDYYPYYQAVMDGHWLSCANVIILKREYYAQYCQFLFGVLFRHIELMKERHILEEPYHEKRLIAEPVTWQRY